MKGTVLPCNTVNSTFCSWARVDTQTQTQFLYKPCEAIVQLSTSCMSSCAYYSITNRLFRINFVILTSVGKLEKKNNTLSCDFNCKTQKRYCQSNCQPLQADSTCIIATIGSLPQNKWSTHQRQTIGTSEKNTKACMSFCIAYFYFTSINFLSIIHWLTNYPNKKILFFLPNIRYWKKKEKKCSLKKKKV